MDIIPRLNSKFGRFENKIKAIPVSTQLTTSDILGFWKVRWGINRMNYKVEPGLYSVGKPDSNSPVLVTANYKMSFDKLRKELKAINAWILVLDTKGINVWCAAGKGTFGTDELIKKIQSVNLASVVAHRTIILPQLGAVGVSAYMVQKNTGFRVVYGPVRAVDIKEFFNNDMKASPEMRTVQFGFLDRLVLTPIELVSAIKPTLITFGLMFLFNLLGVGKFTGIDTLAYLGSVLVGCALVPVFLPFIPVRAFALKGWLLGMVWAICVNTIIGWPQNIGNQLWRTIAYVLILPSVSAYYGMNFTGSSTYTSLSGVKQEMKIALPLIIASIALGMVVLLYCKLVSL